MEGTANELFNEKNSGSSYYSEHENNETNLIRSPHHVFPKMPNEFRDIVLAKKFGKSPEDADR